MINDEIKKSKVESTKKGIDIYVENLVKTTERVLFYKHQLAALEKKSKLSEDDKKRKEEYKANIENMTEGVAETEIHIDILKGMKEAFEKDEQIAL
jgi:hypothetical protein